MKTELSKGVSKPEFEGPKATAKTRRKISNSMVILMQIHHVTPIEYAALPQPPDSILLVNSYALIPTLSVLFPQASCIRPWASMKLDKAAVMKKLPIFYSGPEDHAKEQILDLGCKAQDKGASMISGVYVVFGTPINGVLPQS